VAVVTVVREAPTVVVDLVAASGPESSLHPASTIPPATSSAAAAAVATIPRRASDGVMGASRQSAGWK
jgi:hypothetical protein